MARLTRLEQRLTRLEQRLTRLEQRLTRLEQRLTRPEPTCQHRRGKARRRGAEIGGREEGLGRKSLWLWGLVVGGCQKRSGVGALGSTWTCDSCACNCW